MAMDIEKWVRSKFDVDFRQRDAFARLNGCSNARVWSFESPKFPAGSRAYFVASLRSFYLDLYRECNHIPRNFYELIQEKVPCRLYFDLEYDKRFNEGIGADGILEQFLQLVSKLAADFLKVTLDRDKSFLILDSSTEAKFSAHVIVHMPENRLLRSNEALAPLIKYLCGRMQRDEVCLVRAEGGVLKPICDITVYTKNRNFRLHRSSKCGKDATLELSHLCRFYGGAPDSNARVFLDSLVVPKDYDRCEVIQMSVFSAPKVVTVIPRPECTKKDRERKEEKDLSTSITNLSLAVTPQRSSTPRVLKVMEGMGQTSPLPELDRFMLTLFRQLNPEASIRSWKIDVSKISGTRSMRYLLNDCRFCYNKGREHKSNNVYWLVNLECSYFVQRCFDRLDCSKFCSERRVLPIELTRQINRRMADLFNCGGEGGGGEGEGGGGGAIR